MRYIPPPTRFWIFYLTHIELMLEVLVQQVLGQIQNEAYVIVSVAETGQHLNVLTHPCRGLEGLSSRRLWHHSRKRRTELTKVPDPILLNDAICIAPMNQLSMLTGYVNPAETYIADPNQDVVYGWVTCRSKRNPLSFKFPISATVSGRSRYMTRAPTRSASLGSSTGPSPAST